MDVHARGHNLKRQRNRASRLHPCSLSSHLPCPLLCPHNPTVPYLCFLDFLVSKQKESRRAFTVTPVQVAVLLGPSRPPSSVNQTQEELSTQNFLSYKIILCLGRTTAVAKVSAPKYLHSLIHKPSVCTQSHSQTFVSSPLRTFLPLPGW